MGLVLAAMVAGCGEGGSSSGDCGADYPAASGTGVVHVATCGADDGDGSAASPYASIGAALAVAPRGATIVVAAGRYSGSLHVERDVTLIGAGPSSTVVVADVGRPGVVAEAPLTLRGIAVEGAGVAGVWLRGAQASLADCAVSGTAAADGQYGFGVLAVDAALDVSGCALRENAGPGLLVHGGRATVAGTTLADNGGAGARFEGAAPVDVHESQASGNVEAGIAVYGGEAIILQNRVTGTRPGRGGSADGIVVAGLLDEDGGLVAGASADVERGNHVEGNGRAGILFGGGAHGIILQNYVGANGRAGVWLQDEAGGDEGVRVEDNDVVDNAFVGVGVTGAYGIILQNRVTGTREGAQQQGLDRVRVGDGIGLFAGAQARVEENRVGGSARAAILADAAAGALAANVLSDNGRGIILQNLARPDAVTVDADAERPTGADALPVLDAALGTGGGFALP